MSTTDKVEYVKKQGQSRHHECHWPGCKRQVAPALWGCRNHWYLLPESLRRQLWDAYMPGQEISGKPTAEYLKVAKSIQDWIANINSR